MDLPKPVPHRKPIFSPQIVSGFWGRSEAERARPRRALPDAAGKRQLIAVALFIV